MRVPPGPFAVNASTFVGMQTAGVFGAVCATLGVVLPSFIIILIVAKMYDRFQKNKTVNGAMIGLKGAVVGLIGVAFISTVISVFASDVKAHNVKELTASIILLAGFAYMIKKKVNPIIVIIISAVIGMLVQSFI